MTTKRALLWTLAIAAAIGLIGFAVLRSRNPEEIRVGVLVPLTGGAASYGENARKGAELALKEFSASHPSLRVTLRVEDSRGEAAVGLTAANKLVDLDHVVAIMGCVTSGVTLAVAPQANAWKVPLVSPGGELPQSHDRRGVRLPDLAQRRLRGGRHGSPHILSGNHPTGDPAHQQRIRRGHGDGYPAEA